MLMTVRYPPCSSELARHILSRKKSVLSVALTDKEKASANFPNEWTEDNAAEFSRILNECYNPVLDGICWGLKKQHLILELLDIIGSRPISPTLIGKWQSNYAVLRKSLEVGQPVFPQLIKNHDRGHYEIICAHPGVSRTLKWASFNSIVRRDKHRHLVWVLYAFMTLAIVAVGMLALVLSVSSATPQPQKCVDIKDATFATLVHHVNHKILKYLLLPPPVLLSFVPAILFKLASLFS